MKFYVCIPACNEFDFLFNTLDSLPKDEKVVTLVCVNQPSSWWNDSSKKSVCINNQRTMEKLISKYPEVILIDQSSSLSDWGDKNGVGDARKLLFETAIQMSDDNDVLVSLDADTVIAKDYFVHLENIFSKREKMAALAVPYYHQLTGDIVQDRKILLYEIYLRAYSVSLSMINSRYNFTPLGSAIAVRPENYVKAGGFSERQAGEDFYLLQSLSKNFEVGNYCKCQVYPSGRISDRVPFGTGPAVSLSEKGLLTRYTIYHPDQFTSIGELYKNVKNFAGGTYQNDFTQFLAINPKFNTVMNSLKKNNKTLDRFAVALERYADGLKIQQYLKHSYKGSFGENLKALLDSLDYQGDFNPEVLRNKIELFSQIREFLYETDMRLKRESDRRTFKD
ncbi:MAG: hypothetical protein JXR48_16290 [Candidatus Delongbacteria bacterium]|nr:hypothetical protein [Candidatus Delongbacteria bacterium]MBN2836517.1 hypothetical protein [Candidatus Delongbacteria bacterium]